MLEQHLGAFVHYLFDSFCYYGTAVEVVSAPSSVYKEFIIEREVNIQQFNLLG